MNDFLRCNKVSGVYWLKIPIDDVKISIRLKPPDDILSLPKFEDYTKESNSITVETNTEEHTFKWQEKIFSAWEIQHYSERHNCITDAQLKYHEMLINNEITPTKVFSYIHDDCHMPMEFKKKSISKLELCMEYLNLNSTDSIARVFGGKSDSMHHLLKSRNSLCEEEKWTAMHVVFDHSDHNEDIYLKQESTLLSIYHNTKQNYLILAPDVNDLDLNPYAVDSVDVKYGVSVDFGGMEGGEELETLLTRLYSKWQKKHKVLVNFIMPPVGKTQYYVTIDLMTATGFEMKNLYIEYNITVPEGIHCLDALHGRTHTTESTPGDDSDLWHFGHLTELCLETETAELSPLKLFLEVVSTDWRRNHRTEGYVYHQLPITPGHRTVELTCLRPEEKSWTGEDKRFFLGGCNLIQDLDVLAKTDGQNSSFIYTASGKIQVRYSVISQSSSSGGNVNPGLGVPSGSSALLLGAEAALDRYKKARARLAAATRDIDVGDGDG